MNKTRGALSSMAIGCLETHNALWLLWMTSRRTPTKLTLKRWPCDARVACEQAFSQAGFPFPFLAIFPQTESLFTG